MYSDIPTHKEFLTAQYMPNVKENTICFTIESMFHSTIFFSPFTFV